MKENIPLIIGRQSSGEVCSVNLAALPNLFLSHSNETQLPEMFAAFMHDMDTKDGKLQLGVSLGSSLAMQLQPVLSKEKFLLQFTHAVEAAEMIHSIDEFIAKLLHEFKRRKTLVKSTRKTPVPCTPLVVFYR